jgi:hypothetical protein
MGPTYVSGPRKRKDYSPAPKGFQRLVCVDVIEQDGVQTQWGIKNYVALRFFSEHRDDQGDPYSLAIRFNRSLDLRSNLTKFLGGWRGKPLTEEETQRFDLDRLIGVSGLGNVTHKVGKNRKTLAIIQSMGPLERDKWLPVPEGFVRHRDRKPLQERERPTRVESQNTADPRGQRPEPEDYDDDDSGIPF